MSEFKTYTEQGVEIKVTNEDFKLVQVDKKIHDTKFESKPTTFAKDAFRRFCKNKSSVVAAIIIGFLVLCAIIIPMVSPHNIKLPDLSKTFLPPKLFEAGTGFWDGTKSYTGIVWDEANEAPADFLKDSVVEITNSYDELSEGASKYAHGGTLVFINNNKTLAPGVSLDDLDKAVDFFQNYYPLRVKTNSDYQLSVKLDDEDGLKGYKLGIYSVIFHISKEEYVVLKEWSTDYNDFTINLSEKLAEAGYTGSVTGRIRFLIQHGLDESGNVEARYLGIEEALFTAPSETDESVIEFLDNISITDPNVTVSLGKLDNGTFPQNYWQSNGDKFVSKTKVTKVDFVYDWYNAKLGLTTTTVGKSTFDDYIKAGYCKLNYATKEFEILNEKKCPFKEVKDVIYDKKNGTYTIVVEAYTYKLKGYDSMPRFLFGTDDKGYDLVTVCFNGLRTSLILAICAFSICFVFGLCWGSISGYFGGNVDLFMERFCDILGGVPSTVVLTLAILLMGDGIVTLGIAMCLTGWMGTAARTRTQFYRFKGREYILASRTLGARDGRLIFKHILPNAMGTIITSSVLMIPSVIFSEASLSYLGLISSSANSFGIILSGNQSYLNSYPALIMFPAVIISLIMISFNLFGNGLRDAFNPSLKGSE